MTNETLLVIDQDCPECNWPERWFNPARALLGCSHCSFTEPVDPGEHVSSVDPSVESDWHGWRHSDGPALHVGPLPSRKSICLYLVDGSVLYTCAYFRNEAEARRVLKALDQLIGT